MAAIRSRSKAKPCRLFRLAEREMAAIRSAATEEAIINVRLAEREMAAIRSFVMPIAEWVED